MTSRKSTGSSGAATADSLQLIAALAARLASEGTLDDALPDALELLRRALEASDCAVWLLASAGFDRLAGATGATETGGAPPPLGTPARGGMVAIPLLARGRRLGVLTAQLERDADDEDTRLLEAAAALFALTLATAEHTQRLTDDSVATHHALEAQHRFIEKIVDSLPVGLYVVDREYRVHAWNRKRETGTQGVLREEALGRTIFEVLRRLPADLIRREFDEVFATGIMSQVEMESRATGEPRIYRVSKIPMRLHDGEVSHVITIGEDITDWKRAQERIAQSQKLAALGQLSAGVMHEINNPLATIAACAESMTIELAHDGVPASVRESFAEFCHIIEHEVHRSKRIVDGLLDFSRPPASTRQPVDVNSVVDDTLFLLKHHPRFRRHRLTLELDRTIGPLVQGSAEQLLQVLMALLLNASDAMTGSPEGEIRLRSCRTLDDPAVVLEVIDAGHGIPASELSKLFEPFYTTKSPGRGTGLGLSICYGIVKEHGGRIEAESTVGQGSTFRVVLPIGAAT